MMNTRDEDLRRIKDEILGLTISPLYTYRTKNKYLPVIGEGNHSAQIMFVGEAPGKNEALTGRPFCGRAGKILDELLFSIGIDRKNVYITNIVKDRPPENRDPLPEEIDTYAPFLDRQIVLIEPRVIVTLGRFSMQYVMNRYALEHKLDTISNLHGKVFEIEIGKKIIKVIPLYHPAATIYNQHLLSALQEDFKILKTLV